MRSKTRVFLIGVVLAAMNVAGTVALADTLAAPGSSKGWATVRFDKQGKPKVLTNQTWIRALERSLRIKANKTFPGAKFNKVTFRQLRASMKDPTVAVGVAKLTPKTGIGGRKVFFSARFAKTASGTVNRKRASIHRLRSFQRHVFRGGPPPLGRARGR